MLEKIQKILNEYDVEEVWSTSKSFNDVDLKDFYFIGKDKKKVDIAADKVLSIIAPGIDSENPEENEAVTTICLAIYKDSDFLKINKVYKLVEGGKILG